MTEDKTKMDFRGRDRVAANEEYDPRAIRYFAAKFGLDIGQVLELAKHGNDRGSSARTKKGGATIDVTKLSDLGPPPITGTRHGGPPKHETDHFVPCSVCGQAFDMRDLRQVFWHDEPKHERLELNS